MDKQAIKTAFEEEYLAYLSFIEECGDDFGEPERQEISWFIEEYGQNLEKEDKITLLQKYSKPKNSLSDIYKKRVKDGK